MHDKFSSASFPPEAVHMLSDPESGLEGAIVIHSTRRGPAAGGCRLWRYTDQAAMTRDALRLAEGMSYKNALADLPLGGGKSVIREPERPYDRRALFEAFGRAVAALDGAYVTAEDVGTNVADMESVRSQTRHVAGLNSAPGRPGGDPSPWTALGVFLSMQECARRAFGSDVAGLTVAVQGLGHVGAALCELLHGAGAKLVVADVRPSAVTQMRERYVARVVGTNELLASEADIFAPCALGGVLSNSSVPRLRARVVCGAANNVLATPEDGDRLAERGVLYAPDYVVNAGGIINVAAEYLGWTSAEAEARVRDTAGRLAAVLDYANETGMGAHRAADNLAQERIRTGTMPISVKAAA